jgi:hypothetical protein
VNPTGPGRLAVTLAAIAAVSLSWALWKQKKSAEGISALDLTPEVAGMLTDSIVERPKDNAELFSQYAGINYEDMSVYAHQNYFTNKYVQQMERHGELPMYPPTNAYVASPMFGPENPSGY